MLTGKKIAILGVGMLGSALISGLLKSGIVKPAQLIGTVRQAKFVQSISEKLGVEISTDNAAAVQGADIVILAVRPQSMADVLAVIKPVVNKNKLIISVATCVLVSFIEERLNMAVPVIRAMPNTCITTSTGMTALVAGTNANEKDKQTAESIFKSVGQIVWLDEKLFNGVTALSACGPAYLYVVIESLAEAGVKLGMSRETATLLAAQTMLGTAKMLLETGAHPALLKDAVTTPGGCTIDGLMELEEGKLRVTLIKAVVQSATRAQELLKT